MNSGQNLESMPPTTGIRPLEGIRVLSTRPQHQFDQLAQALAQFGAEAVSHPVIQIEEVDDQERVRHCLQRFNEFEIAVFLSRNAAIEFNKYKSSLPPSADHSPLIGAIGTGTKRQLESSGFEVAFLPDAANSSSMGDRIVQMCNPLNPRKVLIIRADRGSEVLATRLKDAAIPFENLAIYRNQNVTEADQEVLGSLSKGLFDWVTITSSAIARNVAALFAGKLNHAKVVSISPQTTATAIEAGLSVSAEATQYNIDGLVEAIIKHEQDHRTEGRR